MWINKILLAWTAFGAGIAVAGGFVAFISLIGIVTRLAGITKTADAIMLYEDSMMLGLILCNILSLYSLKLTWIGRFLSHLLILSGGFFTGIFVGCLAGALAEVVNIIPIFSRRMKLRKGFPYMVKAAAVGKCIGCLLQLYILNYFK
ncbi:MAG: stage V sporulation protein AB [Eubacterium sp.]|nr:stage V sporulation protein AB [Eubacterium sp.]MDD7209994.1 stage V sporulation protein AB [Lachnospiraceae bacterium]MDY5496542.1 stage V sporulation protein AB [Anaerobutyricum sp.]